MYTFGQFLKRKEIFNKKGDWISKQEIAGENRRSPFLEKEVATLGANLERYMEGNSHGANLTKGWTSRKFLCGNALDDLE